MQRNLVVSKKSRTFALGLIGLDFDCKTGFLFSVTGRSDCDPYSLHIIYYYTLAYAYIGIKGSRRILSDLRAFLLSNDKLYIKRKKRA